MTLVLIRHTFVNIHCDKGYGKSVFLKQFANEISRRSIYPHGVYYLYMMELENVLEGEKSLKGILTDKFGTNFEGDVDGFFNNTNMLLIIDDCDKLINYTEPLYSFRNKFLNALARNKVSTILATKHETSQVPELGPIKSCHLPKLNNEESLMYLLAADTELFEVESDLSSLINHPMITSAKGKLTKLRDLRKEFLNSISTQKRKRKREKKYNSTVKGESESDSDADDDEEDDDDSHNVYGREQAESPVIPQMRPKRTSQTSEHKLHTVTKKSNKVMFDSNRRSNDGLWK